MVLVLLAIVFLFSIYGVRYRTIATILRAEKARGHMRPSQMGGTGFEQPPKTSGNTPIIAQGGAKSGALAAENDPVDPDFQVVIERWKDLSEATKAHVVAMVCATDAKG